MRELANIGIGGGRIGPGKGGGLVGDAKGVAERLGVEILLMDADLVFGRVHLESAVEHALRAFERGRNVADTRMMEVLLYVSGERQLSTAIEKMGVKDGTERLAVVVSDSSSLGEVMRALAIERDDSLLVGDVERLAAYGIFAKAIETVGKEKAKELVLERVAAVDLLK